MEPGPTLSPRVFRLWIATYCDWRPQRWNDAPPRATAVELVEDALYSDDEAALFLQGFNGSMLSNDKPVWAVAVPVTVRYEGDAEPGAIVRGHVFADEQASLGGPAMDGGPSGDELAGGDAANSVSTPSSVPASLSGGLPADHDQGFGQSPQRSR